MDKEQINEALKRKASMDNTGIEMGTESEPVDTVKRSFKELTGKGVKEGNEVKTTVGKLIDVKRVGEFLKANPKIAKVLQSKWTKLGGKALLPASIAYNALKDLEVFNESNPDFSGNIASDTGEVLKMGAKGLVDAGTNLAVNLGSDAVSIGDSILKGLAWGLGQAADIGGSIQYIGASDESRKKMDKDKTDYSQMFYNAINDLGISDKWESNANKTKAGMKEFLYGNGDDTVYQRTLDKYNKSSGIDEYGNKVLEPKETEAESMGFGKQQETIANKLKVENKPKVNDLKAIQEQGRRIVQFKDGTYGYASQGGDTKGKLVIGIDESGNRIVGTSGGFKTLDEAKQAIDSGVKGYHLGKIEQGTKGLGTNAIKSFIDKYDEGVNLQSKGIDKNVVTKAALGEYSI